MPATLTAPRPARRAPRRPSAAAPVPPPPAPAKVARVHAYARAVVAGEIVAGRYVVAACRRHLADLARSGLDAHGRPFVSPSPPLPLSPSSDLSPSSALSPASSSTLVFRPDKAEGALEFFEDVLHLEDGKPFKLEEFQVFILGSIYGWYRIIDDGTQRRRFRFLYAEIGKANGKTPMAAGMGLYGLVVDHEIAPEIYSAAAAKDQAMICFKDAVQMVQASPALAGLVEALTGSLTIPARHAVFRPLSSEDKGQHGKRVHVGILDEIHAHKSAAMARAIIAGTKARQNALIVLITNSGSDRTGICWNYHETSRKVLEGTVEKDDLFAYVCALDPCPTCLDMGKRSPDPKCPRCDDFRNPATWIKANPRLGAPEVRRYVAERVELARSMPSELNDILQLNFCTWTQSDVGWVNMYAWHNLCLREPMRLADFAGRSASVAMDAANKVDITSMVAVFERTPGSGKLDPTALNHAAQAALAASLGAAAATLTAGTATLGDSIRDLAASGYACFAAHFVPADMVANADGPNHELYREWRTAGKLIVTEGARTSFARIMAELAAWRALFRISRFSFDPREMSYFVEQLSQQPWCDFPLVEVSQSPQMISQPMKELEALINSGLLAHNGDPVLTWMMGNVIQKSTQTGSQTKAYFPARPNESSKIDGAAALIMAVDGALRTPAPEGEAGVMFF